MYMEGLGMKKCCKRLNLMVTYSLFHVYTNLAI